MLGETPTTGVWSLHTDGASHANRLASCASELREWLEVASALNGVAQDNQLVTIANLGKATAGSGCYHLSEC